MAIPTGRLTFQQIRDLALRKAGNPQLGVPLTSGPSPGTLWLTQILFSLYTLYEWPFLFATTTVSIGATSFTLPTDFYQPQDDEGLIVVTTDGGVMNQIVYEIDRGAFEVMNALAPTGATPQYYTVDRQANIAYTWPNTSGHTNLGKFRYKQIPITETTPPPTQDETAINASVPVFPWHDYLIQALYVDALSYERDPRYETEFARREDMLRKCLQGANPLRSQNPVIPLDPDVFQTPFRGD